MSIKIIADSACDISREDAERFGICVLPLTVIIDGKEYKDRVTISPEEFYEKLKRCKKLPTTSQLSPEEYAAEFLKAAENGEETVVITVSEKISGTFQSAVIAAQEFPGKIHIVDSQSVSIGERVLVDYAVRLRDEGLCAGEIVKRLEGAKKRAFVIARFDTLENLKKSGRLSKTSAIMGTLLNIKPVLSMENGEIVVLGKARGSKQSSNFLNEMVKRNGGIDFTMPYMLAYSGTDDSALKDYIENSKSLWEEKTNELPVSMIGSCIGTHAASGAIAVAFFANEERQV